MTDSEAQTVSVELLPCDVDNDELSVATFYKSKSRKVSASSTSVTKL